MSKLVIVESPTKAKTISKFLGKEFKILSSFGHVRDLPKNDLGVDVEGGFTPKYVIPTKSRKHVTELKKAAEKAETIYLASDEDREGEAISWHLSEILGANEEKLHRITFHEITKTAIEKALEHPRKIDMKLVDAQQTRRILDRLVGYKLSPLLWKKIQRGLSAGRVQSVAVRLVVEREREREAFKQEEYWSIDAVFQKEGTTFEAKLVEADGKKIDKMDVKTEAEAKALVARAQGQSFVVLDIQKKRVKKAPPTPFTTSTLQQEANVRLGMSAKQTMTLAQQLYETGRITYMRTDSLNLSDSFLEAAHEMIEKQFGTPYRLAEPRRFKTKSKGAQEAHEAIRPTDPHTLPASLKGELDSGASRLYNLIWSRTIASQMPEAELERVAVDLTGNGLIFRANGSTVVFDGFMKVYRAAKEVLLPTLKVKETVELVSVTPAEHFTEPPARYSDATLVKTLEEYGIGRPSTYAPTIATIIARTYVERDENKRLFPTEIGKMVTALLIEHFPQIVDYSFTAKMEQSLDEIAEGEMEWVPMLKAFYGPFALSLTEKEGEIAKMKREEIATDQVCEKCGKPMVIKFGRFGKFLACTGFPECRNTKPLKQEGEACEILSTNELCSACGATMVVKQGRFGNFLSCSRYPDCKTIKSLDKTTGVKCPECLASGRTTAEGKEGEITEKRSKRGKIFYSCNRYPDCKFALWNKPTGETCERCGSLMVQGAKETSRCSNKECK